LRALSRSLGTLGFGTIEHEWLLKAALAVKGLDITRRFERLLKEEQDLGDALQETARSMRDVIVFIKRDAGIPHAELLPYKLPLALLARFFHLHPQPSPRSRELLVRWIWRGAITETHRGESIAVVRASLAAIGTAEERSVQELLAMTPPASVRGPDSRGYNFRAARTKLQINALLALKPRDLRSGEIIDGPVLIGKMGASALPRIFSTQPKGAPTRPIQSARLRVMMQALANRLIHPSVEAQSLLTTVRHAPQSPHLLSHGIGTEAAAALRAGDALGFLRSREDFLFDHVRQFLNSKARWGESDRGSLQSLIVPDEEDGDAA
jgi:hypothetical protein